MMRGIALVSLSLLVSACGSEESATPVSAEPSASQPSVAVAVAKSGQEIFKQCAACHTVDKGGRNGIGPNLFGIVGRAVGSADGYSYTPALKSKGGDWDAASLDAYIADPRTAIPGNKMTFTGIKDQSARAALIDYLGSLK